MVATSINPKDWVHVETPTEGHLGEIIKSIVQELDNLQRSSDVIKNQVIVESASAFSLDMIAALIGLERRENESDTEFRSRIYTWVNTIENQTYQAIEDEVYRIASVIPQIDEYPDIDFMTEYGMSKNEGIIRVLIPFNRWEIWGDDISNRLPAVVAAGIAVIAESYNRYFEEFYDTLGITDWLIKHLFAYPPLTQEILPHRVAFIGLARIGAGNVIGTGITYHPSSKWDEGFWDTMYWDDLIRTTIIRDVF